MLMTCNICVVSTSFAQATAISQSFLAIHGSWEEVILSFCAFSLISRRKKSPAWLFFSILGSTGVGKSTVRSSAVDNFFSSVFDNSSSTLLSGDVSRLLVASYNLARRRFNPLSFATRSLPVAVQYSLTALVLIPHMPTTHKFWAALSIGSNFCE